MHNIYFPFSLVSLLLLLFVFFNGCSSNPLTHHGEEASRKDHPFHANHVKVTQMQDIRHTTTIDMIWVKQAKQKAEKNNVMVEKHDSNAKAAMSFKRGSKNKGFERSVRKLAPRQHDVDAYVAYADYRGPQRHPPKNN